VSQVTRAVVAVLVEHRGFTLGVDMANEHLRTPHQDLALSGSCLRRGASFTSAMPGRPSVSAACAGRRDPGSRQWSPEPRSSHDAATAVLAAERRVPDQRWRRPTPAAYEQLQRRGCWPSDEPRLFRNGVARGWLQGSGNAGEGRLRSQRSMSTAFVPSRSRASKA
jgi:hypothetical protein